MVTIPASAIILVRPIHKTKAITINRTHRTSPVKHARHVKNDCPCIILFTRSSLSRYQPQFLSRAMGSQAQDSYLRKE